MFLFAQHDKGVLKRTGRAQLGPEQIQTRVRIGLSAVGEMLIKRADIYLPVIVQLVGNTGRR